MKKHDHDEMTTSDGLQSCWNARKIAWSMMKDPHYALDMKDLQDASHSVVGLDEHQIVMSVEQKENELNAHVADVQNSD